MKLSTAEMSLERQVLARDLAEQQLLLLQKQIAQRQAMHDGALAAQTGASVPSRPAPNGERRSL